MTLIFATNNRHKTEEINAALPAGFSIISLREAGINIEIPEPHHTLEANAAEKAGTIYQLTGADCFSEDTGLEVDALNNEPGVHSARYAGEERSDRNNILKLLRNLENHSNRKARFRTVICLVLKGKQHFFEGVCEGWISREPVGESGFGYDPVFIPDGALHSFAEMTLEEKNRYSHRKKALERLVAFLSNLS
ncbi:MAG TPA: RdgB/HAM1 family non-canonical purine NTP pyrophosphatase [Flavisolibacter sp.]|nr:RdgB/HAM1 family non-canonical purine NTP pyrophosphatase [Flavisolibacter sp.]